MALKSTVYKAELAISDIDRHYYASHSLALAQHPSETDRRLMLRLLAFVLFADERLRFGRGLSCDDEPDLWNKSLSGEIELWVDLGQPDEARIRRACGRARRVAVMGYGERAFAPWWAKQADALARFDRLAVLEIDDASVESLTALISRSMQLQCLIQDGEVQLLSEQASVVVAPRWHRRWPEG